MSTSWDSDRRANYEIVHQNEGSLVIRDLGPWDQYMTVTNAAEVVVEELDSVLNGRRLFYYDSEDEFGEIIVENGRFSGFRFAKEGDLK